MIYNYYKKNIQKLRKEARERYQNHSEEEKEKKRQHGCEKYKNLLEHENRKTGMQEIKTI